VVGDAGVDWQYESSYDYDTESIWEDVTYNDGFVPFVFAFD